MDFDKRISEARGTVAKPVIFAVDLDPLVLRVPGSECLAESAGAGLSRRALSFWPGRSF